MIRSFKEFLPHILVVFGFIIISLAYFSPVLQGKEIFQSDIVQYTGMAKQQNDFRAKTGEETYWTDAAFGGMPTYLSLIHISEPTRRTPISYAVFCLKKKK